MDFNFLRKPAPLPGLCGLYLSSDKLILTHAFPATETKCPRLSFMEASVYQKNSLEWILASISKKHQLVQAACSWVLSPEHYQLLTLIPPKVQPEELKDALRWQIKDLITFPPEDACIDYFSIPAKHQTREKIEVVVAQTSRLQSIADHVNQAGFSLQSIDIPELALRNLNALYDDSNSYLGLLAFDYKGVKLIITYQKNLLLTREVMMNSNIEAAELSETHEFISLLKQSFTYCQNEQQLELPQRLLVSSPIQHLPKTLKKFLGVEVEALNLTEKLQLDFAFEETYLPREYLSAIGGTLRDSDATN